MERFKREMLSFYDPEFGPNLQENDIIVAGTNFGCSSSRPSPFYLKLFGVGAIIVESYSQIFYRNCWAFGLPILESQEITKNVNKGDLLEVDIPSGSVRNLTTEKTFKTKPPPRMLLEIMQKGDLYQHLKSHPELVKKPA